MWESIIQKYVFITSEKAVGEGVKASENIYVTIKKGIFAQSLFSKRSLFYLMFALVLSFYDTKNTLFPPLGVPPLARFNSTLLQYRTPFTYFLTVQQRAFC